MSEAVHPSPPSQEVSKFVTRVWEHPLIDPTTRNHRKQTREKVTNFFDSIGISPQEYVAIPVGSCLWVTDHKSDDDWKVITNPSEGFVGIKPKTYAGKLHLLTIQPPETGLRYASHPQMALLDPSGSDLINLLFTPDELLAGNLDLAHNLRLKAVDTLAHNTDRDLSPTEFLNGMFETLYKSWIFYEGVGGSVKAANRTRNTRFFRNYSARAEQTSNPALWKEGFRKAWESFRVPDFETYRQGIHDTVGSIELNPRYKAQALPDSHVHIEPRSGWYSRLLKIAALH